MDRKLFGLLLLIPFAAIVMTYFIIHEKVETSSDIDFPESDSSEKIADTFMNNAVIFNFNELGLPKNEIISNQILHYPGNEDSVLQQPKITLYEDQGAPWLVSADKGLLSKDGKKLILQGNTIIKRDKSDTNEFYRLDTPELTIWPNKEFAETDQFVKLTTTYSVVTAIGMKAHLDTGRYYLLNNVRGHHEQH